MQLQQTLRELGYKLAVQELYGANTPAYFKLRSRHRFLLNTLYKNENRT